MKNCAWCGMENQDVATCCVECGTDRFKEPELWPHREDTAHRKSGVRRHFLWPLWNGSHREAAAFGERDGESFVELKELSEPAAPLRKTSHPTDLMFFKMGDQERGPYTREQLRNMWRSGQVTADALCRPNDSTEWLPMLREFEAKSLFATSRKKVGGLSWPNFRRGLPKPLQNQRALALVVVLIIAAVVAITHHVGAWIRQAQWERDTPAREAHYAEARKDGLKKRQEYEQRDGRNAGRKMYQLRGVTLLWPKTENDVRQLGEAIWTHPHEFRQFTEYSRGVMGDSEHPSMKAAFIQGFLEGWLAELNQSRRLER